MENEPGNYAKIWKIMLPGDYIAMKMTGEINTTVGGLSEGIFWDFKTDELATLLISRYGFDVSLLPDVVPTFGPQGTLGRAAADELGLMPGIPVSYRAGDQPNNALSLKVLNPGEIAATAGTSGVVYGVSDMLQYDPLSRVNTFAHVNHSHESPRLGVLLCINGTGILNAWLKKLTKADSYEMMNRQMAQAPQGADGLVVLPFGNGAERILQNKNPGARILNLDLNRHTESHLFRAAHEGIAFAFAYGMEILEETGINASVIRAGKTNMFLSPVFGETLAAVTGTVIELYNTDGSIGAARAAAIGSGFFKNTDEAFANLKIEKTIRLENNHALEEAYQNWKKELNLLLNNWS
jgi:xylulokinase